MCSVGRALTPSIGGLLSPTTLLGLKGVDHSISTTKRLLGRDRGPATGTLLTPGGGGGGGGGGGSAVIHER